MPTSAPTDGDRPDRRVAALVSAYETRYQRGRANTDEMVEAFDTMSERGLVSFVELAHIEKLRQLAQETLDRRFPKKQDKLVVPF